MKRILSTTIAPGVFVMVNYTYYDGDICISNVMHRGNDMLPMLTQDIMDKIKEECWAILDSEASQKKYEMSKELEDWMNLINSDL